MIIWVSKTCEDLIYLIIINCFQETFDNKTYGVRFCCLCPSFSDTEMLTDYETTRGTVEAMDPGMTQAYDRLLQMIEKIGVLK